MQLNSHQTEAKNVFFANINNNIKGVYIFHDVGTGKTISSLNIANQCLSENKINKVVIITTSSVQSQFNKEAKTHLGTNKFNIYTYDQFKNDIQINNIKNKLIIVDEAHKLRNIGSISRRILNLCKMN